MLRRNLATVVLVTVCGAIPAVSGLLSGPLDRKSPASKNTKSVMAGDPRLDRRLSLSEPHLPLGELLDRLGEETGVDLSARDRFAPISGYELTVVAHDLTAREILEAIPRLFSSRSDRWFWTPERDRGSVRYTLHNSQPVGAGAEVRRQFGERFRQDQHRRLSDFYSLPPERREALARSDPFLAAVNDPAHFDRNRSFFSFVENLSPDGLRAIGSGQRVDIPAERRSAGQRQFIQQELNSANPRSPDGAPLPGADQLQKVTLSASGDGTIYLRMGSIGGHGVLGGIWLDAALGQAAINEWGRDGDKAAELDRRVPVVGEPARPEELRFESISLDKALQRVGRLGRINVLLDCAPGVAGGGFSSETGLPASLREILAILERYEVIWKHRGPFFLFRRVDWPELHVGREVPWPILRGLRKTATDNAGFLRPQDWTSLANLRRDQLESLVDEFPDANPIANLQTVLRLMNTMSSRERVAVARSQGAGWDDFASPTRRRLLVLFPPEDAQRVRLAAEGDLESRPPVFRVYFGEAESVIRPREIPFRPRLAPSAAEGTPNVRK